MASKSLLSIKPEFRVFIVEVSWNPGCALPQSQYFGGNLIALPLATPGLSRRGLGQLGVQVELVDVDALVPGQRGVTRSGLETEPALGPML